MDELRECIRKHSETIQTKRDNAHMKSDDVGHVDPLLGDIDPLSFLNLECIDDDDQTLLDAARCESDCITTLIAEIDPPPGCIMEELPLGTNLSFPKGYDDINFLEMQDECDEIASCFQTEYEKIVEALKKFF